MFCVDEAEVYVFEFAQQATLKQEIETRMRARLMLSAHTHRLDSDTKAHGDMFIIRK